LTKFSNLKPYRLNQKAKYYLISKMFQPVAQFRHCGRVRYNPEATLEFIPVTGYWHSCQYDGDLNNLTN